MNRNKILVIGSSNTDMVIKTQKFPAPGETILGGDFFMTQGGKGANQAVAAKRCGGTVAFVGKIGNDIFGSKAMQHLEEEGISTRLVATDPVKPSGVAMIMVDGKGENSIIVADSSNGSLSPEDIDRAAPELETAGIILLQLEIPIDTVTYVAERAAQSGKTVILNPAPAAQLPDTLLKNVSLLIPNENEAAQLTGVKVTDAASAEKAALALKKKGVKTIVITMGSAGAFVLDDNFSGMIPSYQVEVVDSKAAGDTFCGALAAEISRGRDLKEALRFATAAAAISVTRMGAQPSIPVENEVREFLRQNR